MPRKPDLKLSSDVFQQTNQLKTGNAATGLERPETVRVVLTGSASLPALDSITRKWKADGFGSKPGNTKLGGVVYEMLQSDKTDQTLDAFGIAHESPGNLPVTLVHPIPGDIDASKLPSPDTAPQFATICFSLPQIRSAADLQGGNEKKWLDLFKVASERELTLELSVVPNDDSVREALESILGKAWDQEVEAARKADNEASINEKGARIVIGKYFAFSSLESSFTLK